MGIKSLYLVLAALAVASPCSAKSNRDSTLFERVSLIIDNNITAYYYSKNDRVRVLEELFRLVEDDYSLLSLKTKNLKIDFEKMKRDAIAVERDIDDPKDSLKRATANLKFVDRAKALIARFQDSHFKAYAHIDFGPVFLPFSISKAEGKYIVTSLQPKLMALLAMETDDFAKVKLGAEILSIDGVKPEEAAKALERYIGASSSLARQHAGVRALTARAFAFAEKSSVVLQIKTKENQLLTLRCPWFFTQGKRGDQALFAREVGYRTYNDLRLVWNDEGNKWEVKETPVDNPHPQRALPARLLDGKNYLAGEDVIIRTGYLSKEGKIYGVLQLNSFGSLDLVDEAKEKTTFLAVIRAFVKQLEEEKIPLIIDARTNGGGRGDFPPAVTAILLEKNRKVAGGTMAFAVNRYTTQLMDQMIDEAAVPEEIRGPSDEEMRQVFLEAYRKREPVTTAITRGDISTDLEVKGFGQKIVLLISPSCASACDNLAVLLKASKRATLIGTPTNGTGAGYMGTDKVNSEWHDTNMILRTKVPNYLFGVPGKIGQRLYPGQAEKLNMENRPITPDIIYEDTASDLLEGNKGWFVKAIEVLEQAEAPKP